MNRTLGEVANWREWIFFLLLVFRNLYHNFLSFRTFWTHSAIKKGHKSDDTVRCQKAGHYFTPKRREHFSTRSIRLQAKIRTFDENTRTNKFPNFWRLTVKLILYMYKLYHITPESGAQNLEYLVRISIFTGTGFYWYITIATLL